MSVVNQLSHLGIDDEQVREILDTMSIVLYNTYQVSYCSSCFVNEDITACNATCDRGYCSSCWLQRGQICKCGKFNEECEDSNI